MTKEEFTTELKRVDRKGIDSLIGHISATDFFKAPASTRFHGAYEGGLLDHSMNVYKAAMRFYSSNLFATHDVAENSVRICSLLHDICKANCYDVDWKWTKDENDKWIQVPHYVWNEKKPFGGHGSKSVYIIQRFIYLSPEEAAAINSHMGAYDNKEVGWVYECNKLAWLIHIADEYATYYMDK